MCPYNKGLDVATISLDSLMWMYFQKLEDLLKYSTSIYWSINRNFIAESDASILGLGEQLPKDGELYPLAYANHPLSS